MSELTERIAGLSPEKRELFTRLLQKQGVAIPALPISRRSADVERLPLSLAQQRLWFLDQLEPGSNFYNIFETFPFNGPLDEQALERSVNEIVRRHEVLRTTFDVVDGQPVQKIAPHAPVSIPVIELSHLTPETREGEVARISAEASGAPFDLRGGPLVRFTLLRLDAEERVLLVGMHHIISDAWSLDILTRELRILYKAFAKGESSPLPDLQIQYSDFAIWQRQWLQGEVLDKQVSYWQRQLSGAPAALELPTDKPRPLVPTHNGASQTRGLPRGLFASIKSLSQRENASPFMALLAAFNVLLHRYTNQVDIVVGTPLAGRNRSEVEGLIGFFVNTLVIRTDLSGDPGFSGLLRRVRDTALDAYAHQDLPFEKLVEVVQPERDTSRNPLFQVSFQLSNVADDSLDEEYAAECGVESEVEETTAKFDLGINFWASTEDLRLQVDYSSDLFEHETIERMLEHFERLLIDVCSDPTRPVSQIEFLTEAERAQLLYEWNDTSSDYPRSSCLHELFETQAKRAPHAIAVVLGDKSLTYGELNKRANQVARRLRTCGVRPEVAVGICMDRSIELVVGLLGILKAGGAYVPLDTEYPEQRLRYMIEDAGVRVMLTQSSLAEALSGRCEQVLCIDSDWEGFASESVENLPCDASAQNPAYIIYTSGSTGRPKGVVVTHSSVARTVCDTNYISVSPSDRIAQASNSSFDAATFEFWSALVHGAILVVIPKETMISPRDLASHVRKFGITVLFLPTALFNQVAGHDPGAFSSLRYLMFGGEMADPAAVRNVLSTSPPRHLLHMYGPTESTTYASWHAVENLSQDASTVPIGRPVSNTQIYLLDRDCRPVPLGVAGELCVGGDGLARGYLCRPELTAERFIPDPFSTAPGSRFYRTGDVARRLPNGAIEFMGRGDEQVKIRGYRIELGEIECVLREHEGVREVVVLAREDAPGEKRLVAYIVGGEFDAPTSSELRSYMRERVPDYMVPTAFIVLEQMPLTPNGKIDRRALPAPELTRYEYHSGLVPPRTPVEAALTDIFGAVLGLASVGVNENFFDLGGHSLLATQIMSRIRENLQIELPLRALFSNPTVGELTVIAEDALKNRTTTDPLSIERVSRDAYRATISAAGVLEIPEALKRSMQMAEG
ncbi:MAG: hypothetical protein QOJ64_3158 [Acidobacteriota bacterium]|jgi:amino acid adenylation domain-containing protein|nr:hypothetical protein [Acidobacteriota bacterium]